MATENDPLIQEDRRILIARRMDITRVVLDHHQQGERLALHGHMSDRHRDRLRKEQHAEAAAKLIELSGTHAEIAKLFGELAERSSGFQHFTHMAEGTSKALTKAGGIGSLIAGALGVVTIPIKCALEKRWPNKYELGQMGTSAVILTLGALAFAAVGGPVGVGVFIAVATGLGFAKTIASYIYEAYEHRKLSHETVELHDELDDLMQRLEHAQELPNSPEVRREIVRLSEQIDKKTMDFARASFRLHKLKDIRRSKWEHFKKAAFSLSGLVAVVGAVMAVTPLAPIGYALMLGAGIFAIGTLVADFIVSRYKKYKLAQVGVGLNDNESLSESDSDEYEPPLFRPGRERSMSEDSLLIVEPSLPNERSPLIRVDREESIDDSPKKDVLSTDSQSLDDNESFVEPEKAKSEPLMHSSEQLIAERLSKGNARQALEEEVRQASKLGGVEQLMEKINQRQSSQNILTVLYQNQDLLTQNIGELLQEPDSKGVNVGQLIKAALEELQSGGEPLDESVQVYFFGSYKDEAVTEIEQALELKFTFEAPVDASSKLTSGNEASLESEKPKSSNSSSQLESQGEDKAKKPFSV